MKSKAFFALDLAPAEAVALVTLVQLGLVVWKNLGEPVLDPTSAEILGQALERLEDLDDSVFNRLRDKVKEALEYADLGTIL